MSKHATATVQEPGIDERVTMEALKPTADKGEQPDDSPTDFIDPMQADAPYLAPGTLSDPPPPTDLTSVVNGLWPGNPPLRIGSFYFDLNRLALEPKRAGLLGSLCENFIFERVDLHLLSPPDDDWSFDIELFDTTFLGGFHGYGALNEVHWHGANDEALSQLMSVDPGTGLSKERVYLRPRCPLPKQGRMLLSFLGYLIEPWR